MKRLAVAILVASLSFAGEAAAQDHSGHAAHGPPPSASPPPRPPPASAGHAADRFFDPTEMAQARALLRYESGGMPSSRVMIDRLELHAAEGRDTYAWEGEARYGGDLNRVVVKSEGEGEVHGKLEGAEVQALYSRAIDPWFDLQAGVRQDFGGDRSTTYLALGVEGLAPYWFEVEGALFLSHRGDFFGRLEASQDFRLTQKLLLSPSAEVNLAFQDEPHSGVDAGVSEIALGLRLHYLVTPRFAPYVGVEWSRAHGVDGHDEDEPERTSLVVGLRALF